MPSVVWFQRGGIGLPGHLYTFRLPPNSPVHLQPGFSTNRGSAPYRPPPDTSLHSKSAAYFSYVLAHVVDHANFILLSGTASGYLESARKKWVESVKKKLDELVTREKTPEMEIQAVVLEGKPYEQILQFSQDRGMDIIVLNLQSKGMLDRAFLGSTAERVVRLAYVPVLSVPVALGHER